MVKQLAFEGREEAFAHGVVIAIPGRSAGRARAGIPAALVEGGRSVLRLLVGMHPVGPPLSESRIEGIAHRSRAQVIGHGQPIRRRLKASGTTAKNRSLA